MRGASFAMLAGLALGGCSNGSGAQPDVAATADTGTSLVDAVALPQDRPPPSCSPVGALVPCFCDDGRSGRSICRADGTLSSCACDPAPDATEPSLDATVPRLDVPAPDEVPVPLDAPIAAEDAPPEASLVPDVVTPADVPPPPVDVVAPPDAACTPPLTNSMLALRGVFPSARLGTGFNPLTQSLAGECVEGAPDRPTCSGAGARRVTMQFARTVEELKTTLGISASASYDAGLWGAEASASYFRSSEVRSDSAYLVLDVEVEFLPQVLPGARITEAQLTRLRADPAAFVNSCGSHFVSSITRGGRFRAVYTFSSLSTRDKEALAGDFSAGGGAWDVSASVRTSIERNTARYQSHLFVLQSGGRLEPVGLTVEELVAQGRRFGTPESGFTCETANPLSFGASSYYSTVNMPPGVRLPDMRRQLAELEVTAVANDRARLLRNDLEDRLSRPGRLSTAACAADLRRLTDKRAELDAQLRAVADKRLACEEVNHCGASEACLRALPAIDYSLPTMLDREHCGPACTDGANSGYESDDSGYCTRCTWRWDGFRANVGYQDSLARSTCAYMRPGARVTLQSRGTVASCGGDGRVDAAVIFRGSSGPNLSVCGPSDSPDCRFNVRERAGPIGYGILRDSVDASSRTLPVTVTAWLTQQYGASHGFPGVPGCPGLNHSGIVIDLCDADRPEGCAFPAP